MFLKFKRKTKPIFILRSQKKMAASRAKDFSRFFPHSLDVLSPHKCKVLVGVGEGLVDVP